MRAGVAITGVGIACPIGTGWAEFEAGIIEGRRGIGQIRNFDTSSYPSHLGAEVRCDGEVVLTPSHVDRKCLFFRQAAEEALHEHAAWKTVSSTQRSIHVGQGIDAFDVENYVADRQGTQGEGWRRFVSRSENVVRELAAEHGVEGGVSLNGSACVASTQAIGLAFRKVRRDTSAVVLTGGFDSMLSPLHYMGFHKLGALSNWEGDPSEACRPFDRDRCGIVLGEGAAACVLQGNASAEPDRILAEIVGYAASTDAWLVTDPEPEGRLLAQAALEAIADAGLQPVDIDAVHLHGTGTLKNDLAETRAMALVFGPRYRSIPVFSLKGQIGHLIGACGAVELLAAIHTLRHQVMPITVNSTTPDPEIDLMVVRDQPLHMPIRHLLKLNAAFGGQNTALVMKAVP